MAQLISSELWIETNAFTQMKNTNRQDMYNCVKAGVIPLEIWYPCEPIELALNKETYNEAIAKGVANYLYYKIGV